MSNTQWQQPTWGAPPLPPPKKKHTAWMVAGGIVAGMILVGVIGNAVDPVKPATRATTAAAVPTAAASTPPSPSPKKELRRAGQPKVAGVLVPRFTGMGLQSAQDAAQAAGFFDLSSHDSLGRERLQIFDRDWKVCTQNHPAGTRLPTVTTLDFGAVKVGENCPSHDEPPPAKTGATMPDFIGRSVNVARDALASDASLTVTDATEGRMILIESNWKVCTQTPRFGTPLDGQSVTLTAVKFGESCP